MGSGAGAVVRDRSYVVGGRMSGDRLRLCPFVGAGCHLWAVVTGGGVSGRWSSFAGSGRRFWVVVVVAWSVCGRWASLMGGGDWSSSFLGDDGRFRGL